MNEKLKELQQLWQQTEVKNVMLNQKSIARMATAFAHQITTKARLAPPLWNDAGRSYHWLT